MKNILVALDFDLRSQQLTDYAASFAEKFEARLWLVHIAAPEPDFVGYDTGPQYIRETRAEDLREEHRVLQKMAEDLRKRSIAAEALLVQGPTVQTLLDECEKLEIDLLVIGSHEHGFLYNLFAENTALELFKKSNIPLLVVPLP